MSSGNVDSSNGCKNGSQENGLNKENGQNGNETCASNGGQDGASAGITPGEQPKNTNGRSEGNETSDSGISSSNGQKVAKSDQDEPHLKDEAEGTIKGSSVSEDSDPDSKAVESSANTSKNSDFTELDYNVTLAYDDVVTVMTRLRDCHYNAASKEVCDNSGLIYGNCKVLMEKDYKCEFVKNIGGQLCINYPEQLIIPVANKSGNMSALPFDGNLYRENAEAAAAARSRSRFVVPVILFDNKFICRSGTLSNRTTATFSTAMKAEDPKPRFVEETVMDTSLRMASDTMGTVCHYGKNTGGAIIVAVSPYSMQEMRHADKKVLEICKVRRICDLMVENRKIYKNLLCVSSSEKVFEVSYDEYRIEKMPYPGCEFFKSYYQNGHIAEGLFFNWLSEDVEVSLQLTESLNKEFPDIDMSKYKEWDLLTLTRNYMKILLFSVLNDENGLLVHCISGWDRTPLFITLLRVSLWADGVIHQSLELIDMAYFTLGFDWYLFGHDMPTRLDRQEEIFHFCFKFVDELADNEFSVTRMFQDLPADQKSNREFPVFKPDRRDSLKELSSLILRIYEEHVTPRVPKESVTEGMPLA